jgi:hypothetical protein
MRPLTTAFFLLAVLLLQATPAVTADKAERLLALVGVWQLDSRVSEDPLRMLRQMEGRSPGSGGGRRGGAGDRDAAEGDSSLARLEERLGEFTSGEEVLTLASTDSQLTITYWDDHQRVLRVDGKKVEEMRADGAVSVKASWGSSDRLLVRTESSTVGKTLEIFELGDRGDKLFVTVELYPKGSKRPFSFQRLYNKLTSGG